MEYTKSARGDETRRIRDFVLPYCKGKGIDMGCGDHKIDNSIGIDYDKSVNPDIVMDLEEPNCLTKAFATGELDFVYNSHNLEDLKDTESVLLQVWTILKAGGYFILYVPHKDLYYNVGHPLANPHHKHDFTPEIIKGIIDKFGKYKEIYYKKETPPDFAFILILQKENNG